MDSTPDPLLRLGFSLSGRGRGRGRGRGVNSDSDNRASSRQQSETRGGNAGRRRPPPPPKPTGGPNKKNGEKGADAHTVNEADRIRWTQEMIELRERHWESDDMPPKNEFPSTLTNTERKFIHQLAAQLGLHSKSSGKGEDRRIAIYPSKNKHEQTGDFDDLSTIPFLQVGDKGVQALQQHFQKFPPSHEEKLESRETGSSLIEAIQGGRDGSNMDQNQKDVAVALALGQMGLMDKKGNAPKKFHKVKSVDLARRQKSHAAAQQEKNANRKAYQDMLHMRSQLPAFKHQEEIVTKVKNHQVTIISGDTGCGKSTQVPQFLLDANPTCNIVVTQPRRIAAMSISERVAYEQLQETTGSQIGYKVRLESNQNERTQCLFMTPGVLLRQLQSDPWLQTYTHIIMDEVHERDQYQEFLLVVLRDLLPQRPDLRLILMSATLQTEALVEYFADSNPSFVAMKGRMYPVQEFFLEHVLDMTGYIQVSVDEDDEGGDAVAMPTMTDDQLEAELARYASTGAAPQTEASINKVHPKLKCVLCRRRNFKNAVELGAHLAICDGGGEEDTDSNANTTQDHNAVSFGGAVANQDQKQDVGTEVLQDMEFEDYDVDAEVELDDFDYNFEAQLNQHEDSSSVGGNSIPGDDSETTEKWDGESPFMKQKKEEEDLESEVIVTKREAAILKQYQSSHDDEQIDHYLLLDAIRYINKSSYGDGAILAFLPGWQEISELSALLESTHPFSNSSKYYILPLHSGIPSKDQRRVLQRPPTGVRKIVLSTNIAETSLTIDDVSFVIDSGRAKEKNYDPHLKTATLLNQWVSAASAKQRKGRAGRTKRGVCFHLFSQRRYQNLRPFTESELLRTPLGNFRVMVLSSFTGIFCFFVVESPR